MYVLVVVLTVVAGVQISAAVRAHVTAADLDIEDQLLLATVAGVRVFFGFPVEVH